MPTKPTSKPTWTDGAAAKQVEPTAGKKILGWTRQERPPFQTMNWLFYLIGQWIDYFEQEIDAVTALKSVYDAVIGIGGTHASIADLMADPNVEDFKNVLVKDPITLSGAVTIDQDGMNFDFKPQAIIAGLTSLDNGLIITGEGIRFRGAKFVNFNKAGAVALLLDTSSKFCIISECYFNNCSTTITNNGSLNNLSNNIEEN